MYELGGVRESSRSPTFLMWELCGEWSAFGDPLLSGAERVLCVGVLEFVSRKTAIMAKGVSWRI